MLQTLATIGVLLGQMQNGKEVVISYWSRQLAKKLMDIILQQNMKY